MCVNYLVISSFFHRQPIEFQCFGGSYSIGRLHQDHIQFYEVNEMYLSARENSRGNGLFAKLNNLLRGKTIECGFN